MSGKVRTARRVPRKLTDETRARRGAKALIACYTDLARTNSHLLQPILHGTVPVQWEHYPADDAIDRGGVYQWFYHSHSPADRPDSAEHGHFHLFARVEGVVGLVDATMEGEFLESLSAGNASAATRHLLCLGLNASGVPISLFTVNSWVTGDLPLSSVATLALLESIRLETAHPMIDGLIVGVIQLYASEIRALFAQRDDALRMRAASGCGTLDDERIEVLSSMTLRIDERIESALAPRVCRPQRKRKPAVPD